MQFPYTEVYPGIYRPILAVRLWGPAQRVLTDGLADTAADRTLLPPNTARNLGIDVDALPATVTMRSATGQLVKCKPVILPLELIRDGVRLCWLGEIAVTTEAITKPHWGFKGFLEFFRADFDGPNRMLDWTAGDNLPVTTPPA
jgi:hypothetical protein